MCEEFLNVLALAFEEQENATADDDGADAADTPPLPARQVRRLCPALRVGRPLDCRCSRLAAAAAVAGSRSWWTFCCR